MLLSACGTLLSYNQMKQNLMKRSQNEVIGKPLQNDNLHF